LPRLQFHEEEERLFRAARHGDVAGIERSLASGGKVNAAAPIDGKTALFRAAVFGHADAVRVLGHGADVTRRGHDGRTALEVVVAERATETDRARAQALDAVAAALREASETL
jgi:ankyrin repeat protein